MLFLLIAIGGRRFRTLFWSAAVFSVVVNTFGAVTFQRVNRFYAGGNQHTSYFQPD
jgi:hypothetical protein